MQVQLDLNDESPILGMLENTLKIAANMEGYAEGDPNFTADSLYVITTANCSKLDKVLDTTTVGRHYCGSTLSSPHATAAIWGESGAMTTVSGVPSVGVVVLFARGHDAGCGSSEIP